MKFIVFQIVFFFFCVCLYVYVVSCLFTLLLQGCAFLHTYLKLRGPCQEAYYNLGRAMHQLGILAAAVHYYKKVLDIKPPLECEGFSCEKEAAFNLSLIYKNSGSMELARMVLKKHIVT